MDFKIQNMVGSCDVKFPIRLEGLVLTHGKFSRYSGFSLVSGKLGYGCHTVLFEKHLATNGFHDQVTEL